MRKRWTQQEINLVTELKDKGLSSKQIAPKFGVSPSAIRSLLSTAHQTRCRAKRPYYLSPFFMGDPIGRCREQENLKRNAVEGSAKLLDALLRCAA